jgi:hypothetical protein
VPYNNSFRWDHKSDYFGTSVAALITLGISKGYSLVYCESRGVNCIFVDDAVLGFATSAVKDMAPEVLFQTPNYLGRGLQSRYIHQPNRDWVWVSQTNVTTITHSSESGKAKEQHTEL